jgi:hypothetical protein
VLAADGVIVGSIVAKSPKAWFGFLPLMAAILTFLMAWMTFKWTVRGKRATELIRQYQAARGLRTFEAESPFLDAPVGYLQCALMILSALGLVIYSVVLFLQIAL